MHSKCTVLCLNGGSSSLKFALYAMEGSVESHLVEGAAEGIGLPAGRFWARDPQGSSVVDKPAQLRGLTDAVARLLATLTEHGLHQFSAVGHRIVHGGPDYTSPQLMTAPLMLALNQYIPFAPVHLPGQLELIQAITQRYPDLPQVLCFDTAFHRRMPEVAQRFPLPRPLWDEGIRRYGFHGLSYEFIVAALGAEAGRRMIIAHLGNGASMAAVLQGVPLDTTMGLTPSGGMMMGTRTGDLDPGVPLYLMRAKQYDPAALERMINDESGLLGVSGLTGDMRTLLEKRTTQPRAAQAVAMFCYHARKCIGALSSALAGLDMLVFTGGIGERAAVVRAEICDGLEHLGIRLSPELNSRNATVISTADGPCSVRVIPTNEDLMIARHTRRVLESMR